MVSLRIYEWFAVLRPSDSQAAISSQGSFVRLVTALVFAIMMLCCFLVSARADKRAALVRGDTSSVNLPADQQPGQAANDACAVGDALGRLRFEVIRGETRGRTAFDMKLAELAGQLLVGDVVAAPPVPPAHTANSCGSGGPLTSRAPCPLSGAEERNLKPKDVFLECDGAPRWL